MRSSVRIVDDLSNVVQKFMWSEVFGFVKIGVDLFQVNVVQSYLVRDIGVNASRITIQCRSWSDDCAIAWLNGLGS